MTFVQTPALALLPDALERLAAAAPDLGGLVASGRAVTLLPARLTSSLPQIAARRLREERLQRTIFAAARTSARGAPAVAAVRDALAATADAIARRRPDLDRPR